VSDAATTGSAPLSDLIAAHVASGSSRTWIKFLEAFRTARVGVFAEGVPAGTTGDFVSTAERPITVGVTRHNDGKSRVLAFADPVAFAARFGQPFNAELVGEALLATALSNPECAGVLVNSALAERSVVIDRATAESLVRSGKQTPAPKPWWRFW